jgi:hypothetical protein
MCYKCNNVAALNSLIASAAMLPTVLGSEPAQFAMSDVIAIIASDFAEAMAEEAEEAAAEEERLAAKVPTQGTSANEAGPTKAASEAGVGQVAEKKHYMSMEESFELLERIFASRPQPKA